MAPHTINESIMKNWKYNYSKMLKTFWAIMLSVKKFMIREKLD